MAQNPKDGRLLYHLTALENLESIILNGLQPRKYLSNFKDIADHEILKDREEFELGQYTPFHFFPGSPFAGKVQKDNVETEFIFITMKREHAEKGNFKIVPRHPLNFDGEPLDWNIGIEQINWDLMARRDYSNHDCKEACMAESLFKGTIPAKFFHCIYVKNDMVKLKVEELFKKYVDSRIFVNVVPGMFVNHD